MTPDYTKAAVYAAETLVKYGIKSAPVSPIKILEQMDNVIVTSFSEISDSSGINRSDLLKTLGRNRDAITSVHTENGRTSYVVAYNRLLPFAVVQRALAREMAHIILNHEDRSTDNEKEADCFAMHLLCPRPLIHAIQASGIRVTSDLLANLTGVFDQTVTSMRRIPETNVPPGLNRFVRGQFFPFFVNFFEYYKLVKNEDGSALVDFGTFMDGYVE